MEQPKHPEGFQLVGKVSCASCKHLREYPNSREYYCGLQSVTLGLAPAVEHYTCDAHAPPIGRWAYEMIGKQVLEKEPVLDESE